MLQNRVYKVYPIAKIAADRLTVLNKNMDKMKTNREKKKYFKIVEDYMENEFTGQLKKLSRKQGQILVKLIHRQTGVGDRGMAGVEALTQNREFIAAFAQQIPPGFLLITCNNTIS